MNIQKEEINQILPKEQTEEKEENKIEIQQIEEPSILLTTSELSTSFNEEHNSTNRNTTTIFDNYNNLNNLITNQNEYKNYITITEVNKPISKIQPNEKILQKLHNSFYKIQEMKMNKELFSFDSSSLKEFKTSFYTRQYQKTNEQFKSQHYVLQQTLLIALINKYFSIELKRPLKKATILSQFIQIIKLTNEKESIEFSELVENRCNELYREDISNGISIKTAKRRMQLNRKIESIHLLEDILYLSGEQLQLTCRLPKHSISSYYRNNNNNNENESKKSEKQFLQSVRAIYIDGKRVYYNSLCNQLILINSHLVQLLNTCKISLEMKENTITLCNELNNCI